MAVETKTTLRRRKDQVVDQLPKRFKALKFGVQSHQDIVSQGVLEVSDNLLYDVENRRTAFPHGPLDPRLGISSTNRESKCATCHLGLQECSGHFGHVRLPLPVFHIGYLKYIQATLQNICKDCARVLLQEPERRQFLKELRRPGIDNLRRSAILKKINEQCRKARTCPYCGSIQGAIRKLSVMKLVHDKFSAFNKSTAQKKIAPESKVEFDASFEHAKKYTPELEKHTRKAMDDLNPLKVLNLFKAISPTDCELLGLDPAEGRPEMFLWQYVPAPPICIRPSVAQENASNEDDITSKLSEIILYAGHLRESLKKGVALPVIMEQWEFLQLQVGMYVNSDVPGLYQPGFGKPIRGFCQRLKGKQGRFRGNLSGKRVDFSGRTVISPDPNLSIEQVAVPQLVAKNLTYPERVNHANIEKLRERVSNGPNIWPGAQGIIKKDGAKYNLKIIKEEARERHANGLEYGDVVERHLEDNDIVLFNRQPSLHKLSIMSHLVKVRPWRTFRLNECVCTPYNADFDGDEMNLHVPQTEEARAEAINLMGVKNNLITPKNGEPIIAATQDFITAAYLLSSKDRFFDRASFTYICTQMLLGDTYLELPPPAIVKPKSLWTGKQIFNVLMRPNKESPVLVNLDAKNKVFKKKKDGQIPDMDIDDAFLVVRNSEVMCGRMDKSTVGGGKKNSVFYVILRDFGPDYAAAAMNRLAKLCARTLTLRGFSIGVGDVWPSGSLTHHKAQLVEDAYKKCDDLIETYRQGKLEKAPGCNLEETLENAISGILSKVRQQAGNYCVENLSKNNAPLIMAKSGSKGSDINVAQMVACVGQQIISGKRVPDGFNDRSLPHFHKNARQPPSKGFVRNSFYTGLVPTEFLFHAISGREGLVDTAVKTAETGYMSRRLMKSLEDLSTEYDDTVRTSEGGIVQFQYGADRLDPVDMEGDAKPVDFARTWNHAQTITWSNSEPSLLPWEIQKLCKSILDDERRKYVRRHLVTNEEIKYDDETIRESMDHDVLIAIDEHESARVYLNTIRDYIREHAIKLAKARKAVGLDPCIPDDISMKRELEKWQPVRTDGFEMEVDAFREPFKPFDYVLQDLRRELGEEDQLDDATRQARIQAKAQAHVDRVAKVSERTLRQFIQMCLHKYKKARVEPGHAVGAVGAQSIGEPGTQMTLKTFHFAGVAGMSITQGVPRIKEIINASKLISTPVITCELENKTDIKAARVVKGRIEKTYISDVISYIDDEWLPDVAKIVLQVDLQALSDMQLGISMKDIADAIVRAKKLKLKVEAEDLRIARDRVEVIVRNTWQDAAAQRKAARVRAAAIEKGQLVSSAMDESAADFQLRVNFLKRMLPHVAISGYPEAARAIIQTSESNEHKVLVEGYGLRACMTTEGVVGTRCVTNSVMECRDVLGIEAARTTIAKEIGSVMGDMGIDPRHMELLADVMTYKGEILGITRFGLAKMRDSVLQLASFEKTPDHLFDAAAGMKKDKILGVSECIIMGQTMSIGTGAFQVVRRLGIRDHQVAPKPTLFEDAWKKDEAIRRKARIEKRRSGMVMEQAQMVSVAA
ncbi:beta and beta-prime subunits of DNA dependent RNA-polymerase [Parathielavia appendiculata]|uniref:DNA-directed RNA polymerase subunit n=1 Tax=Parathielavia appendiculata TaxID=2587402 RepID=A0AAN6U5H1_9PEZI|nr:beta and beta-prime subunits of DNA dependent RNA-polymerase [Parathielavia appendiculata]